MVSGVSGRGSPSTEATPSAMRLNPSAAGDHSTTTSGRATALAAAPRPTTARITPRSSMSTFTWMTRVRPSSPTVSTKAVGPCSAATEANSEGSTATLTTQTLAEPAVAPARVGHTGYARNVKVAVSIPDPLFAEADRLAKRRKLSRSQLYAEALELLVSREDRSEITRRLNEVYSKVDSRLDPGLAAAQSEAVREEW